VQLQSSAKPTGAPACGSRKEAAENGAAAKWHRIGRVTDFPKDSGACVKVEGVQIAVYRFAAVGGNVPASNSTVCCKPGVSPPPHRNEWYACQNMCPHKRELVLSRGIIGDTKGMPKVACPIHKKAFSLESGKCLSGDDFAVDIYLVKVEGDDVYLQFPAVKKPAEAPMGESCCSGSCHSHEEGRERDALPCLAP
jgi:NAD(P)H-dependent nitrite reductase small subunit